MVFKFRNLSNLVTTIDVLPLNPFAVWRVKPKAKTAILTKPVMRNLHRTQTKKNLIVGCTLAGLGGYSYKTFVADVRKMRYAEFYRNYDAEAEFETMRKKGVFQSC